MSHNSAAEKAAGMHKLGVEQYGTVPDDPTKAPARSAAVKDNATKNVSGGSGGTRGAGKGMKG